MRLPWLSGTTGKPKGALFDHHRIIWVSISSMAGFGLRVGERLLHVAPLLVRAPGQRSSTNSRPLQRETQIIMVSMAVRSSWESRLSR